MNKYIDAEKLKAEIERRIIEHRKSLKKDIALISEAMLKGSLGAYESMEHFITSLQQEESDEQPEYGYLSTEYVHGKKSRWNVDDILAYYISTSNEEGEYPLGKIVNVEFDKEDGWVYTFENESMWDEQSLVEEEAYKKN